MKRDLLPRIFTLDLPKGQSAFLWGARNTGKSTFLHQTYLDAVIYDLLETDQLARLLASPHLLRQEIINLPEQQRNYPAIIDELQKIPMLLNEVHWLIENENIGFILCGSSAKKLRRTGNLLGGRAFVVIDTIIFSTKIQNTTMV